MSELIDVAATSGQENGDGIVSCLVRYGALGHVGRVGSNRLIPCRRGDRVIVHTDRGLEVGEVLEAPRTLDNFSGKNPAGELLRVMTDEDQHRLHKPDSAQKPVLQKFQELIAERDLPVTAVDAELLFDGQTMMVYYLGEHTEKLGPITVELSNVDGGYRIQFQRIESLETTKSVSEQAVAGRSTRSKQETIKQASNFLRGTIMDELARDSDKFTSDDASLLKFHGTYQQDDRDARKARKPGTSKKHIFMVRTIVPGGKMTAAQLLAELHLCNWFANGTLRITTRQGLQLHGLVIGNLQQTIQEINRAMLTTLGACGDVVRNVMCCPAPHRNDHVHSMMQATAADIAKHFAPRTCAYYEIWVDGEKRVEHSWDSDVEAIYGSAYLPRKFKIGVALPNDNCIDVYTQDIGLLAVVEAGELVGYNMLVGGGLGTTPSVKDTFPRLGDPMSFVPYADVLRVVGAIVEVQRDYGNRENRRRARMKYLVAEWGIERFKAKVEEYLGGEKLDDPHSVSVHGVDDHLGWHPQGDGNFYFGLFVENGRIKDEDGFQMKTGVCSVLERFRMPVRLTPQQNILLCDLKPEWHDGLLGVLHEHGVATHEEITTVRRHAMACPALPTCGLAITESERVLPSVIDQLEAEVASLGLGANEFTVRMTGCPNGCARPYTADIGLVGKAVGKYTLLVGGKRLGDRLNFVYKDIVPVDEIVSELLPLLLFFKAERRAGESLGDFCHRKGLEALRRFVADLRTTSKGTEPL